MAVGTNIWTWWGGRWQQGDIPVMKAADHGTWLGTLVFDGARAFEGLTPEPRHQRPVYIRPMAWSTGNGPGVVAPNPDSTVFCLCLEELPMAAPAAAVTVTTTQFTRPTITSALVNAKAACLYPNNARMLREAFAKGFNNVLALDPLGNVAETATANVFMVKDGVVKTPVPNGTFLNGITRQRIIGLLRADGVEVQECTLSLHDFRQADEVFMAGNISKVTRVSRFDDVNFKSHAVSDRAREIYWAWAATGPRL